MSFSTMNSEVFPALKLARYIAKGNFSAVPSIRVAMRVWPSRQHPVLLPLALALISLLAIGLTMASLNDFAAAILLMPDNLLGGIDPVSLDSLVRGPIA